MHKPRFIVLTTMILTAAAARLLPHPPNVTPIGAMALFAGACFADKRLAFAVPLAAMALSDLILGLHPLLPWVYGSFALTVCLGFAARRHRTPFALAASVLGGSVLFYLVTNFGVWVSASWYPPTAQGLCACYVAALPFFRATLFGDLFYTALLFGVLAMAEKHFPVVCEPVAPATDLPRSQVLR